MSGTDLDWTPAVIEQLSVLLAEGHSYAEIGRRMGSSKNAISAKVQRLGLADRGNPAGSAHVWTATDDATVERLLAGGYAHGAIGREIGVSAVAVGRRVKQLGLAPRDLARTPKVTLAPLAIASLPAPAAAVSDQRQPEPCCWPIGEPGQAGFRYCDAPAEPRRPYCAEHFAAAWARTRATAV